MRCVVYFASPYFFWVVGLSKGSDDMEILRITSTQSQAIAYAEHISKYLGCQFDVNYEP